VELEEKLDEAQVDLSSVESEWRRKHETEKAQLKLAASHDRMELMSKLQEDHRKQMNDLRMELNNHTEKVGTR